MSIPTAPPRSTIAIVAIGLAVILAVAGWLRFGGGLWDEGQHLHPDERFLMMVTSSLGTPDSVGQYFDSAHSPLNPRNRGYANFVYGTLPTTLLHGVGHAVGREKYGELLLVGRRLNAAADLGTVALCFVLGLLVVGRPAGGLLAAAFYAAAVLPIQQSHFFVVDPLTNLFVCGSLTVLVWTQRAPAFWKWPLAGALWGAALACKLSVYSFLTIPAILAIWQLWEPGRGLRGAGESRMAALERAIFRLGVFGLVAFAVFRVGQPDAFRGPGLLGIVPEDRWMAGVAEIRRLMSGETDSPPGHQWTGRLRYWFPWSNMVLWGMGPALGLMVWGAAALAGLRLARGRCERLLLPFAWTAILFLHQGGQWVMSMRYFLPIYPALAVLAAWALVDLAATRRATAFALGTAVVAATLFWAVAFTAVYRSSHSRVEASRWILRNIPTGTAIGNEVWDDALPLRVDGRDPYRSDYRGIDMHWYAEDDAAKLDAAVRWLDEADTLVLSSNRLYDSIPRLWMRYPMTTRYYEALFAGELGFTLAREFHSYPRFAGIEFPDQGSEEAFTVYDHPRVQIFRKTADFDRDRVRAILAAALPDKVMRLTPLQESRAPGGLRFDAADWARRSASSPSIGAATSEGSLAPTIRLFLWLFLLGPLAAPILFALLPGLPERGWMLSRCFGLVLVGWGAWAMAALGIAPFSRASMMVAVGMLAAVTVPLAFVQRGHWRAFLAARWRLLALGEVLFAVAFFAIAVTRWSNPDLWHPGLGGEKPMDMAYLNAVLRTADFPPHSPWLAGFAMNYYHFGYVLAAVMIKLGAVAPEVGFNLAVAGFYALFASALFAVGTSLAGPDSTNRRRCVAGAGAFLLVAVAGNLGQWLVVWRRIADGALRPESWFWDATRGIAHPPTEAGPITEFPFFTFLFADLHPHLMALPLFVVVLGFAIALSRSPSNPATLAAASFLVGTLWVTNPWDLPAAAAALLVGMLMAALGSDRREMVRALAKWAAMVLGAYLLFLPFHLRYGNAYGAFQLWRGSRTAIGDYLLIHGAFLVVAMVATVIAIRSDSGGRKGMKGLAGGSVLAMAVALAGFPLPAVLILGIAAITTALLRRGRVDDWTWPLGLVAAALGIGIFTEFLVLRGDISRMNTVFKFYLQAWVLFGLGASALALLVDRQLAGGWRTAWRASLAGIAIGVSIYPITATPARIANRLVPSAPRTLDGLAFLEDARIRIGDSEVALRDDLAGIRWLRKHAVGLPIIAEGTTHPQLYGWGARFATHTGLPAIVGWDWHQRQQFAALPMDVVAPRVEDVKRLYTTPDPAEAWKILHRHGAEYLVVGGLEKAVFPEEGVAKFAAGEGTWWTKVFESGALTIYRVPPTAPPGK